MQMHGSAVALAAASHASVAAHAHGDAVAVAVFLGGLGALLWAYNHARRFTTWLIAGAFFCITVGVTVWTDALVGVTSTPHGKVILGLLVLLSPVAFFFEGAPNVQLAGTRHDHVGEAPSPAYVFVSLGFAAISAASGGYVTAWAASDNPLIHSLALGIIVLGLSALSALQSQGKQPIWYQLAQVAVSPLAVLAGGLIRLRVLGIL